ncbi:MAG: Hpt domain-containing protein, partial [Chitinophagaceae bacterium]|nr:Hpt domain-containing protein [Chitinophagaceae bacterium]
SYLLKQTGNKAVVEEMIKTFLEQLPVELAVLRDAIEQEDRPAVFHAAHVLRNSTGLFGLQQTIGLTLLQIEKMARNDYDLDEIRLLFYEVDKACKMILENSSNQIC